MNIEGANKIVGIKAEVKVEGFGDYFFSDDNKKEEITEFSSESISNRFNKKKIKEECLNETLSVHQGEIIIKYENEEDHSDTIKFVGKKIKDGLFIEPQSISQGELDIKCEDEEDQCDTIYGEIPTKEGQKKYACDKCNYQATRKSNLIRHIPRHKRKAPIPKHICDVCGYKCFVKLDFLRHFRVHAGKLPFVCLLCVERFNEKVHRDYHIIACHSSNKELMNSMTSKVPL